MADGHNGATLLLQHHAARYGDHYRKCNTNLAMIACILQDAPGKMLTFTELMKKLEDFVTGDRKAFENNIRVCLSTSKCFVKIPMYPQIPCCKLNYWKLDHSQITAKMVRRHFMKLLAQFPELAAKRYRPIAPHGGGSPGGGSPRVSPGPVASVTLALEPAAHKAPPARRCGGVKFHGPFSIESLLRRDSPSPRGPKAPPPSPHRHGWAAGESWRSGLDHLPVETLLPGSDQRGTLYATWCSVAPPPAQSGGPRRARSPPGRVGPESPPGPGRPGSVCSGTAKQPRVQTRL